jgi:hypothetical protein
VAGRLQAQAVETAAKALVPVVVREQADIPVPEEKVLIIIAAYKEPLELEAAVAVGRQVGARQLPFRGIIMQLGVVAVEPVYLAKDQTAHTQQAILARVPL